MVWPSEREKKQEKVKHVGGGKKLVGSAYQKKGKVGRKETGKKDNNGRVSSVQDGIYALGKAHMHSTPSLRSSPMLPLKQFQCWSDGRCPFLVLSRKIGECGRVKMLILKQCRECQCQFI